MNMKRMSRPLTQPLVPLSRMKMHGALAAAVPNLQATACTDTASVTMQQILLKFCTALNVCRSTLNF